MTLPPPHAAPPPKTYIVAATVEGSTAIYISRDGGVSWGLRGPARKWLGVAMSTDDGQRLYAVSEHAVFASANGGDTWHALDVPLSCSQVGTSQDGAVVALLCGTRVLLSTDFGGTWQQRVFEEDGTMGRTLTVAHDGSAVVVVTLLGWSRMLRIFRQAASTGQWEVQVHAINWRLNGPVACSGNALVILVGSDVGQAEMSTDGGATWLEVFPIDWNAYYMMYSSVSQDGQTLLSTRVNYMQNCPLMKRSTDGGSTWTEIPYCSLYCTPYCMSAQRNMVATLSPDGTAFAVTLNQTVLPVISTDAGATWTSVAAPPPPPQGGFTVTSLALSIGKCLMTACTHAFSRSLAVLSVGPYPGIAM